MTSNSLCKALPPTFAYHVIQHHFPQIYIWFWSIGGACFLITAFVIIPHLRDIRRHGIQLRDQTETLVLSMPHSIVLLITSLPLVLSFNYLSILCAPIGVYTFGFISRCYEAFCLYFFGRLLILYMGSFNSIIHSLDTTKATKFWASLPFACCFRKCIKPKHLTQEDFRIIYILILQHAVIPPIASFVELFRAVQVMLHIFNFQFTNTHYSPFAFVNVLCLYVLVCVFNIFVFVCYIILYMSILGKRWINSDGNSSSYIISFRNVMCLWFTIIDDCIK